MIVLYLIDLYPKLVFLTVGLSKILMSALLVDNGFCLCSRSRVSSTDLGLSRLRVLGASMMLSGLTISLNSTDYLASSVFGLHH